MCAYVLGPESASRPALTQGPRWGLPARQRPSGVQVPPMLPAPPRVLGMLLLAILLPLSYARAGEAEDEREPRLILEGGHPVQAGQVIVLEWTAAFEVEELEILLSLDGGRS